MTHAEGMTLGVVFIVVAVGWLVFRQSIAHYQYRILTELVFKLRVRSPQQQIKALEHLGTGFAALLLVAGITILILYLLSE